MVVRVLANGNSALQQRWPNPVKKTAVLLALVPPWFLVRVCILILVLQLPVIL